MRSISPTQPPSRPSFMFLHVQMFSDNAAFTILLPRYSAVVSCIYRTFCSSKPPLRGDIFLERFYWRGQMVAWSLQLLLFTFFLCFPYSEQPFFWQMAPRTNRSIFLRKTSEPTAYRTAEIVVFFSIVQNQSSTRIWTCLLVRYCLITNENTY